jgi:hypothetical protein
MSFADGDGAVKEYNGTDAAMMTNGSSLKKRIK